MSYESKSSEGSVAMKQIDLEKIEPDPLAAARLAAGVPTIASRGKIRAIDDEWVSICLDTDGTTYVEYPRSAIAAAFADKDNSDVVLLVHVGADLRFVTSGQVQQPPMASLCREPRSGCRCDEPGPNLPLPQCPPGWVKDHNGKCWPSSHYCPPGAHAVWVPPSLGSPGFVACRVDDPDAPAF